MVRGSRIGRPHKNARILESSKLGCLAGWDAWPAGLVGLTGLACIAGIAGMLGLPTPVGPKTGFSAIFLFAPYGDSGRFDVTGWSGNILRIELDPVRASPFCLTE